MAMEFAPDLDQRVSKGKFAVAAVTLDDYLPMRSTEMKNRTSTDGIKSVRLITEVKTLCLPDGRFDLEAYNSLINTQINGGAEGVIVRETTGEGHLMSWDEHIMLIGHTVNCFGANIKVIGNTGSNSTREAAIEQTVNCFRAVIGNTGSNSTRKAAIKQGFAVGMHAALHVNPYYGKTSTEGLISHFKARVLDDDDFVLISRPSNPEGLQSIERLGKCISAGHVAIQSLEVETELACYLRSGGLAPVTSGGNNFPKRTTGGKGTNIPLRLRRLFPLSFKESGQASAVVIDIGEAQWIVDSGAAASLTGDSSLLEGLHTTEVMYFRVANGQIVISNTCGRASGLVNLSGIRYSPGCHQNIISARHLINLGCVVTFDGEGCSIRKNGVLIGKAPPATEPEGLFYLDYLRDAQLGSICWACPHPTVQGN